MCLLGIKTAATMFRQTSYEDDLRTTTNHIYNSKNCIGQGASSIVYRGHSKGNMEDRALKMILHGDQKAHRELIRELDAFMSIRHKNIVKFFDLDTDDSSHSPVIVMEYVSGGSLQTFLQEPENLRGIGDKEFCILVKDLASGLEQLHLKGFIHRDIKPANILRAQAEDGRSVYKISDFGSSRQLETDSGFQSLAGTEEYLHPAVYHKAFFNRHDNTNFGAWVDMWSLGITFYQAVTGSIPFQPHGGVRSNRIEMYKMISQKPRGAISGTQEASNSKIMWRKSFPSNCNMSMGLQTCVLPMVKGLVDNNPRTQWSFDTFHREAQTINNLMAIYAFITCTGVFITLYLQPTTRYAALRDAISLQTQEPSENHFLMYENKILKDLVNSDDKIQDYPKTSYDKPIVVMSKGQCGDAVFKECELGDIPKEYNSGENTRLQMFKHEVLIMSLTMESVAYIDTSVQTQHILRVALMHSRCYLSSIICGVEERIERFTELFTEKRSTFDLLLHLSKLYNTRKIGSFSNAEKLVTKNHKAIEKVKVAAKTIQSELKPRNRSQESIICDTEKCVLKTKHACSLSKEIWKEMLTKRKQRDWTYIDDREIAAKRRQLRNIGMELVHRYKTHCKPQKQSALRVFTEQRSLLNKISDNIDNANRDVTSIQNNYQQFALTVVQVRAMILKSISTHFEKSLNLIENCERLPVKTDMTHRKIKDFCKVSNHLTVLIQDSPEIIVSRSSDFSSDANEDRCRSPRVRSEMESYFSTCALNYSTHLTLLTNLSPSSEKCHTKTSSDVIINNSSRENSSEEWSSEKQVSIDSMSSGGSTIITTESDQDSSSTDERLLWEQKSLLTERPKKDESFKSFETSV